MIKIVYSDLDNEIKDKNKLNSELIADIFEASSEIYKVYQVLKPAFNSLGKNITYKNYGKVFSYYDGLFHLYFHPNNIHNFFDQELLENSSTDEFLQKFEQEEISKIIEEVVSKRAIYFEDLEDQDNL